MHRLSGLAKDLKVLPVVNAETTRNGEIRPAAKNNLDLVEKELRGRGDVPITPDLMREVCTKTGNRPTSYSYFLQQLVKAKVLKKGGKVGNMMRYTWAKS